MSKKISLGVAATIAIIAMAVTFSLTMVVSMKMFNTTVSSVKNKERQYNKLSEIDRFVRAGEFFTIDEDTLNDKLAAGYMSGINDRYAIYYTAKEYSEKQAIETEYGVTGLAKERRDAFAPQYDKANILGTVLCVLSAVPVFAAMMVGASFLVSASVCLVLTLVACGVYAFVRVGTVRDAMDQLLEEGDYTRPNKSIKSRINALTAAYWLVVVAIFLWYTFGPNGNGQPQYSWFIWAIAGVMYAALVIAVKAFMKKNR